MATATSAATAATAASADVGATENSLERSAATAAADGGGGGGGGGGVQPTIKVFRFVGEVPLENLSFACQVTFLKDSYMVWVGPTTTPASLPNLVRLVCVSARVCVLCGE